MGSGGGLSYSVQLCHIYCIFFSIDTFLFNGVMNIISRLISSGQMLSKRLLVTL